MTFRNFTPHEISVFDDIGQRVYQAKE